MATITDKNSEIEIKLDKIQCLNDGKCELHKEIMDHLAVIHAISQGNHLELADLRQGIAIILEAHGIPCDEISGWDLNTYREKKEEKKNVRGSRIQRSRHENKDVNNRKISFIGKKIRERKIRRGKKNV